MGYSPNPNKADSALSSGLIATVFRSRWSLSRICTLHALLNARLISGAKVECLVRSGIWTCPDHVTWNRSVNPLSVAWLIMAEAVVLFQFFVICCLCTLATIQPEVISSQCQTCVAREFTEMRLAETAKPHMLGRRQRGANSGQ